MADAIYGGATIEATQNDMLLYLGVISHENTQIEWFW